LTQPLVILLAEDDLGHATLIRRNLTRAGVVNEVVHVTDGQQALDYIFARGPYAARPGGRNLMLLLDINLPLIGGVDVLRQLKADPTTARIPTIMLTTTDDPREVAQCYELGCSVYIVKPLKYETFVEAMRRLGLFLEIIQVPSTC
jgi:CheY-like chemotaxis protein